MTRLLCAHFLLSDVQHDNESLLKLWSVNPHSSVINVANIQGTIGLGCTSRGDVLCRPHLSCCVSPSDITMSNLESRLKPHIVRTDNHRFVVRVWPILHGGQVIL